MRKRCPVKIVIWLFIIGVALLGYVFIEPYWPKVDYQTFAFQDLPKSADNLKVVGDTLLKGMNMRKLIAAIKGYH